MESYQQFLKPEVLAKLKQIDLKARLVVEGFLAGLHRSPYKGFSQEFAEYRSYLPGDEIKRIDWKLYAKTDRFYIKEYEEETNLKAYLLIDASGSMRYASGKISKLDYASYLAAGLSYLLIKQRDSVGLVTFTTTLDRYIPPRSNPAHLKVLLHAIDALKAGGDTNLANTFHKLAEKIKRRGLVIILSDLFDNKENVLSALKHFRHRKHEVLVFHILDKNELDFTFSQPLILKDLETSKEITLDPRVIRKQYQKTINEYFADFKIRCREHMIDYNPITSDTPLDRALFEYLQKRSKYA
ncbi:MAG: DUF58 domain-containing protein [Candidatus Latescibacteria bacterium]|nr:DUF58 domain-containing protein [Candidatus Latescibacterota bacterium]